MGKIDKSQSYENELFSDLRSPANEIEQPQVQPGPSLEDDGDDLQSPLDVAAVNDFDLGLVNEIASLILQMTLAPWPFCRLVALVTVATVLQRNAKLPMAFGDIYANLFCVIIAMSSFYNKSTAINHLRILLKKAQLPHLLLPSQMSSEGLVEHLTKHPAGVILNDEIGRILGSHKTKYLINLKADLTDYFDCRPIQRVLRSGTFSVPEPYVNILGATTPEDFFDSVEHKDWRSGFLARFLFVQPEGEPDFDAVAGVYTGGHEQQIVRIAQKLNSLSIQPRTDFVFGDGAFDLWDDWQRNSLKQAFIYGDNVVAPLVKRYNVYALKFSMILAASHGSWGIITPEVMQTAMNLSDHFKSNANQLLLQKQNFGISGGKLERVLRVLDRLGKDGHTVTTKQLYQATNMTREQLMPCLDKLVEIGCADSEQAGRGFRYVSTGKALPVKTWH